MGSTRPAAASRRARADGPAGACPPRARSAGQRDAVGCFRRRFRVRGGFMIRQSVIFDVGKVLFDWDLRHLFAKLIDDPAELEWFVGHVVTPEWHLQHDAGRPLAEMVPERKAAFPDHGALIRDYATPVNEPNPAPVPGSLTLGARIPCGGARA